MPTPGYKQQVNPDYLTKKRELEIACDDCRDFIKSLVDISKSSGKPIPHEGVEAAKDMERKTRKLEFELSQIPVLIEKVNNSTEQDEVKNLDIQNNEPEQNEIIYNPIEVENK